MADRGRAEESVWRASASKKSYTWEPPKSGFRHGIQSFLRTTTIRLTALLPEYTTISVYKRSIMLSTIPCMSARKIARSVPRVAPKLASQQYAQRALHALTGRTSVPKPPSAVLASLPDSRVLGQKRRYFLVLMCILLVHIIQAC